MTVLNIITILIVVGLIEILFSCARHGVLQTAQFARDAYEILVGTKKFDDKNDE